ncbi:MAG TPA: hypothetical protein DIT64_08095 [Verrucomicrobiales bacterium]|nr:hypothetical protein [Verrucomicrobiales bacterium]
MNAPPPPLPDPRVKDDEHLRLLAIFHWVLAGLSLLGMGFLGLHYGIMRMVFGSPEIWKNAKDGPPPEVIWDVMQWFYLGIGVLILLVGFANLAAGFSLRRKKHHVFCLVVAGLNCLQFPFGTALGVFTFIVLLRDSVRAAFKPGQESAAAEL